MTVDAFSRLFQLPRMRNAFVCCCEFHFFPETKDFFPYIISFQNFRYGANYAGAPSGDIGNVIFLNASDCDKRDRTIANCIIQI